EFESYLAIGTGKYKDPVIVDYDSDGDKDLIFGTEDGGLCYYRNDGMNDIDEQSGLVISNYVLNQNYPNPFNPTTNISYNIKNERYNFAEIVVYNVIGEKIWSSGNLKSSQFSVLFDGSKFNTGVYYYTLVVDRKNKVTKPMILIK
ncbi:MAG: T9SS type A sorting domain-containing protein, partial [Candidatus Delongbacteria bacterium]|nr:T9SS type A sorting domain-containing protein [Candidatus Delongbacteria bacterium]